MVKKGATKKNESKEKAAKASMTKALIAMSGGVDSSVAAKLMHDAGYDCIGCTMKLYRNDTDYEKQSHTCCTLEDVEDARSVAFNIGIPYYVFNFADGFKEKVIDKFVASYEQGKTPNPCIDCNHYLKFEKLMNRAHELSCDYVVTGHYARIEHDGQRYVLKKALDATKDQSYVLYLLTQEQLAHTLFPLGNMTKQQVRACASNYGFINAEKEESQDICFVADGNYPAFIRSYTGKAYPKGDFLDTQGNVVGQHQGIINYTVGQRKGLGIALGKPMYVQKINAESNTVTICEKQELYSKTLIASDFNWISGNAPQGACCCKAKVRYRQQEKPATAIPLENNTIKVVFDEPISAIALGQAVVLYNGDVVLGGGTITAVLSE